jgi:hypothetical protein
MPSAHLLGRNFAEHLADEKDDESDGVSSRIKFEIFIHTSDFRISDAVSVSF